MRGKVKQSRRRTFHGCGKPTAVDLFCGCGGLTVGLKRAGFQILGAVDIDPLSVETYKANHRDVRVWEADIRDLEPSEPAAALGLGKRRLDLLAGCPPCQGFSTMRTLNGALLIEDPRNDLLLEFQRFVEALHPRAVMMENVPGLADDERFASFCRRMEEIGYIGNHRILNVADYGVPQRRRRLVYLAGLGVEIPFAGPARRLKTVRDAIGGLPKAGKSGDPVHDMPERRSPKVLELIRRIPKDGGSRTDLSKEEQLECHRRCDGFKDVYGRMAWDEKAAESIKRRVSQALLTAGLDPTMMGAMYIGTIHSYCQHVLGDMDATYRQYDVLDENRLKLYLISRFTQLGLWSFRSRARNRSYFDTIKQVSETWKTANDELLDFNAVATEDPDLGALLVRLRDGFRADQYIDFSLMIRNVVEAIRNSEPGMENGIGQLRHLMVDEYQIEPRRISGCFGFQTGAPRRIGSPGESATCWEPPMMTVLTSGG